MMNPRPCLATLAAAVALAASATLAAGAQPERRAEAVVAEAALARGDCRIAAETYARAAEASRDAAIAERATEVAVHCQHWPARARSAARWRALAPEEPAATRAVALVQLGQHRLDAAVAALRDLFGQRSADADSLLGELIPAAVEESDTYAAFAALRAAAPLERLSAASLTALGQLGFEAYDFSAARALARRALARDAGHAAAHALIARTHAADGLYAQALEAARAAIKLDPEGQRFALADTLATLDRVEETRLELDRLKADESAREEAERRLALLAFQSGDFDDAERRLAERLSQGEGGGETLYYLALIAERRKDFERSLRAYEVLANAGLAELARPRAARLLLKQGDRAAAMSMLDDHVAAHPESAVEFAIAKAQLLAEIGEAAQGAAIVDTALAQHPEHPTLAYEHAVLLERAGNTRGAIGALDALLKERPQDPTVLNALGYTLADHGGDLRRAERLIRRALDATPDHPAVLDSLGWVRFRRGDSQESRRLLERAYLISGDPEIAAHWGEVLWTGGEQGEARKVWAQALARNPDAEPLRAVLERFAPADGQ